MSTRNSKNNTAMNLFGGVSRTREISIEPQWALVCSRMSNGSHDGSLPSSIFTTHDIRKAGTDRYIIGSGSPTERAAAVDLLAQLADQSMALLPESVVAHGPQGFAWTVPAGVRPMKFRIGESRVHLIVPWPPLLLIATLRGLRVFARHVRHTGEHDDNRPVPHEKLYHAPLANIFADGSLCWGNIKEPALSLRAIPEFEKSVFETYFTSANHNGVLKGASERSELHTFWKALHDERADAFLYDRLCAAGQTVAEVCRA